MKLSLFPREYSGNYAAKPFGKVAGYYDTRGKPTATVTVGASDLPLGTKLFSFIDVATEESDSTNLTAPYGELRLSRKADFGLGVAVEYNRDFSQENGTTRTGFVFEPNLHKVLTNAVIGMKMYPVSTHEHGMQAGFYANANFWNRKVTLDSFLDYNLKPGKIVTDFQIGYRIAQNFYGVVENRYNGFRPEERWGVGVGLEWKL